ncbi:hypothetical protein KUTeg_021478 [Tegillarca granosa]|uniref:THAP-type domain-containing protein n=1 Tax=Tegillarca granosa TaxID=220873 RepID=A0ABQ9E3E2_TEGGR|nr:hypothetical protein KUTeg_021478 [Tegillarca granosa]
MPAYCCVPGCSSRTGGNQFPKDKDFWFKWQVAVKRMDVNTKGIWQPSNDSVVCKLHFTSDDYLPPSLLGNYVTSTCIVISLYMWIDLLHQFVSEAIFIKGRGERPRLKKMAIPSVFPFIKNKTPSLVARRERIKRRKTESSAKIQLFECDNVHEVEIESSEVEKVQEDSSDLDIQNWFSKNDHDADVKSNHSFSSSFCPISRYGNNFPGAIFEYRPAYGHLTSIKEQEPIRPSGVAGFVDLVPRYVNSNNDTVQLPEKISCLVPSCFHKIVVVETCGPEKLPGCLGSVHMLRKYSFSSGDNIINAISVLSLAIRENVYVSIKNGYPVIGDKIVIHVQCDFSSVSRKSLYHVSRTIRYHNT